VLEINRFRQNLRRDRSAVETSPLLQYLLVVGEAAAAVEHFEIDDRAGSQVAILQQGTEPGRDSRDREPRERALVGEVDSAQRQAPDITRGFARSRLRMRSRRSA
jgi:hypothetical protein